MTDCSEMIKNALFNFQAFKVKKSSQKIAFNFEIYQDRHEYIHSLIKKDLYQKYECKTHLQACILFSELGE